MFLAEKKAHAKKSRTNYTVPLYSGYWSRSEFPLCLLNLAACVKWLPACSLIRRPGLVGTAGYRGGYKMLYYTLVFLLVALIAGALGFGAVSFAAAGIAKICFFIFIVLFLVSLFMHIGRGASRSI